MRNLHSTSQKKTVKQIFGLSTFVILLFFSLTSTNFHSSTHLNKTDESQYKSQYNIIPLYSASVTGSIDISNINTWENYPQLANGTGTIEDPYIIENVTFDAQLASHTLKISNSQDYIKIRNCTFSNSKNSIEGSIFLDNSSNIQIINCSIVNNDQNGIYFRNSWNNAIENNTIRDNLGSGIYFIQSDNNNISNNQISSNTDLGILVVQSSHNMILNNIISSCLVGINIIIDSSHNTVTYNTITYSNYYAFQLWDSTYNTITENTFSFNAGNVIYDHDNDPTNLIYNNYGLDSTYTNTYTEYDYDDYFDFPEDSHDTNFINILIIAIIIILLVIFIGGNAMYNSNNPSHLKTSRYRSSYIQEGDLKSKSYNQNPSNPSTSQEEIEMPRRTKITNPILYCPNCGCKIPSRASKIGQPAPAPLFCYYCGANLYI